ncbi:MAG: pyrroline-5-carboxylate reductase family protein, partial [Cyclobacteriaceae bacterium]
MNTKKIAIIGGGNLGTAIAEGLLKSGFAKPAQITITRRTLSRLEELRAKGVTVTSDNALAIRENEVIIVALKPFNVKEVLTELKNSFDPNKHIVISVVTGIFLTDLSSIFDQSIPIFRAMPNTAIAIQESVTCLCSQGASADQSSYVKELFDQLGITISIDEKLMDAATVLGA